MHHSRSSRRVSRSSWDSQLGRCWQTSKPDTQRSRRMVPLHNRGEGNQQVRRRGGNRSQRVQHHDKRQHDEPSSFRKPRATGEQRVCTGKQIRIHFDIIYQKKNVVFLFFHHYFSHICLITFTRVYIIKRHRASNIHNIQVIIILCNVSFLYSI